MAREWRREKINEQQAIDILSIRDYRSRNITRDIRGTHTFVDPGNLQPSRKKKPLGFNLNASHLVKKKKKKLQWVKARLLFQSGPEVTSGLICIASEIETYVVELLYWARILSET